MKRINAGNGRYDIQIKNIITADGCSAGGGGGSGCAETYTVVGGDTCMTIESKTGISDAQLRSLNPAINIGCTNLQVGQNLCLKAGGGGTGCGQPYTVVSADTCTAIESKTGAGTVCTQTYTVVSGDTCAVIESKTGTSDAQLHAQNPVINTACTNLSVGHILCLSASGGGCSKTYIVVSGDTCAAIESKNAVSDVQLHARNPAIDSGCTSVFSYYSSVQP
ncbi:hypothetical protein C8J57DRAFT_1069155 [Mycena rebaudengoi]|nr:hypothetical protein C8J57DRAFT_1069155 [Mycena rebaudengoi]